MLFPERNSFQAAENLLQTYLYIWIHIIKDIL